MTAPAGWYPDNTDPTRERYWDGAQWTHQSRETPSPSTAAHAASLDVLPAGTTHQKGFLARRKAERQEKLAGRDAFESLAMNAALGDESAITALPNAVREAMSLYGDSKFEQKKLEVLAKAVRHVINDDVLSRSEEQHLERVSECLGVSFSSLQSRNFALWEELWIARINDGRPVVVPDPGVMLQRGETAFGVFAASLMKEVQIRQYRGGSSGVGVPIGFGMRYRTSSTRGRSVVVGTELVVADTGRFVVTSKRSMFVGHKKTLEFRHDRLVGLQQYNDGLQLNVSNRQTASLLRMPRGTSPSVAAASIAYAAGNAT